MNKQTMSNLKIHHEIACYFMCWVAAKPYLKKNDLKYFFKPIYVKACDLVKLNSESIKFQQYWWLTYLELMSNDTDW